MRVAVLAVQGGFEPHATALSRAGHVPVLARTPRDLEGAEGLVLPGGESTAQLKLIHDAALVPALRALVEGGAPVLATCAGLILSARTVRSPAQESFGWIDAAVARNGWGRQLDSFEAAADDTGMPLVFIRAPRITEVGPAAEVVERFRGEPILVRQARRWGACFHPELTDDLTLISRIFG